MVKKTENTEQKIIQAARTIFLKKGMDGARMQEIADEAGINKSLLHYYFRSKEKLFDKVFTDTFSSIVLTINEVFEKSVSLSDFIENFVTGYTNALIQRPYIPNFVLNELTQNPQRVIEHINSANFDKKRLFEIISDEDPDKIKPFNPVHILVDILALCVFPFVAQPVITGFIFEGNDEEYETFIRGRTQHVIDFVKTAIFIQK